MAVGVDSKIVRHCDLYKPLTVETLPNVLVMGDNKGDQFQISVTHNGQPVDLLGSGISGRFIRIEEGKELKDCETVILTGTSSGNVATVVLDGSCYVTPGHFVLSITILLGANRHTVFICQGVVARSTTNTLIDPGKKVPTVDELLDQLARLENALDGAISAASSANTAAGNANSAANSANAAAANANSARDAANTAASNANSARDNANKAAEGANTAASNANAARDAANTAASNANSARDAANTAASNANAATQKTNAAIENANAATQKTNAAIENANAATKEARELTDKWDDVDIETHLIPFDAQPDVQLEQTAHSTTFHFYLQNRNLAYSVFEVDDEMNLIMTSPEEFNDISFELTDDGYLEVSVI